jgi:hypothetical protein
MTIRELLELPKADPVDQGKVCSSCGEWKEYGEFHKSKRKKDGYVPQCKTCRSKHAKRYHESKKKIVIVECNEYRGIKLHDSVKLYKNDGSFNSRVKASVDKLVDVLHEKEHLLLSEYIEDGTQVLIDFNCGHEAHWIVPYSYKNGRGCPKCSGRCPIQAKEDLLKLIQENGHELLSEYVNTMSKVLIDFGCMHKPYWITPNSYKQGRGCKKCGAFRATKWSRKQAKEGLLKLIQENGHEILSEYVNDGTKVLIDFKCGHDPHPIRPGDYKKGNGCRKCAGLCPIQAEEDFKRLLEKNGHKLLNQYVNAQTQVLIDFNCGHEARWIKPNAYNNGNGCSKCNGKCPIQAKENFYQEVEKAGYKTLGEYKGALTTVKLKCDKGHVIDMIPGNFTSLNNRCRKCAGKCPIQAKEELLKLIKENGHELLSEYKNTNLHVLIDFNCGHKPHRIRPYSYKQKHGCPLCNESRGERIIREYLETNGIAYKSQYKFPNDNREYDFYLPLENTIVEVHGQQHYEEVDFFRLSLEEQQLSDRHKEKYAKEMGFNYIVVDYREHDPRLALERFIAAYEGLKGNSVVKLGDHAVQLCWRL